MKDRPEGVDTPKKCIRKYCLFICEKKGRKGSKRDMVNCLEIKCPLHPYRTGQLKARRGPIGPSVKRYKIAQLEQARKWVVYAEAHLEKRKKMLEDRKAKNEEILKPYYDGIKEAEEKLEARRKRVRDMEIMFNDELERGLWGTDKSLEDAIISMEEDEGV